jgi:hypothetical protein
MHITVRRTSRERMVGTGGDFKNGGRMDRKAVCAQIRRFLKNLSTLPRLADTALKGPG